MKESEYIIYDGLGLAELVKKKEVTPKELMEIAIAMIEKYNPAINAVITKTYDFAEQCLNKGLPDGPFAGVPFLVKDLFTDIKGYPHTCGSRLYQNNISVENSELINRYLQTGVIILGKTNAPELGALPTTEPLAFGACHNPWDLSLTPGGSSGGSAAAVAARFVPIAHGNDGGGSLRIPASCCHLFTIKPSRGRVPNYRPGNSFSLLNCDHILSHSVRDSAAMLDATCVRQLGTNIALPPLSEPFLNLLNKDPGKLRIAKIKQSMLDVPIDSECLRALDEAEKVCVDLGHEVEELDIEPFKDDDLVINFAILFTSLLHVIVDSMPALTKDQSFKKQVEPSTYLLSKLIKSFTGKDMTYALLMQDKLTTDFEQLFTKYDAILTPALAKPAVKLGQFNSSKLELLIAHIIRNTTPRQVHKKIIVRALYELAKFTPFAAITNFTGQPSAHIPMTFSKDKIPLGVLFSAAWGNEALLLQLARQFEQSRPWHKFMPKLRMSQSHD